MIFGALLGLGIAWLDALKTTRRELTPIGRDDVLFEQPLARLRRRLLLGHQSRNGRLAITVPLVAVTAFGLVTGVDRADAVGGMAAGLLVYLGMHNLGLMGTFARIEHDARGELVSTVAPPAGPMPLLVLPRD